MKFDTTTMMGVMLGKRRELTGRQAMIDAMVGQAVGSNPALALVVTDRLNRRHASNDAQPRPPSGDSTAPTTSSDAEPKPKPKPKPKPSPVAVAGSIEGISDEIVEAMEVLIEKHGTDVHEFLQVFLGEVMKARKKEFDRMLHMIDRELKAEEPDSDDPPSGMRGSEIEVRPPPDDVGPLQD